MKYVLNTQLERIKFAREAGAVERCHVVRKNGTYDIAQHCFNMLSMLRILWPDAPRRLLWAIQAHDLPELLIGDIPAPAKWAEVVDTDKLGKLEVEILEGTGFNHEELTADEQVWLKSLDMLELYLWVLDQCYFGNLHVTLMRARIEGYMEKYRDVFPYSVIELYDNARGPMSWNPVPNLGD